MTEWKNFVKEQYRKMKAANGGTTLGDAMKKASKLWKTMKHKMAPSGKTHKKMRKMRRTRKGRKGKKHGGAAQPLAPAELKVEV